MSKLAKKPIVIPDGITAIIADGHISIANKENTIKLPLLESIIITPDASKKELQITIKEDYKQSRANWGTMASLIKNAIQGLQKSYTKELEIEGIGYKAALKAGVIVLNVGYTHPVEITPPAGVTVAIEKNVVKIVGFDKAVVGQLAANIRRVRPPEPYQGKGIRYRGEVVRRKAGKKAAGTTTA